MNKSLLIVICDFLLLSLLSLARFDDPEAEAKQRLETPPAPEASPMAEALKLALEDERAAREQLNTLLAESRKMSDEQKLALQIKDAEKRVADAEMSRLETQVTSFQTQTAQLRTELQKTQTEADTARQRLTLTEQELAAREQLLAEREARIRDTQAQLANRDAETARLNDERIRLREQLASTTTTVTNLQTQLASTGSQVATTVQEAERLRLSAAARATEAALLEKRLASLEESLVATEAEKGILMGQLRTVETEARLSRAQVDELRGEVKIVRDEKARLQESTARLSEGIQTLAKESDKLAEEVRTARPLSANAIFSTARTNQVLTHFQVGRKALLGGDASRQKETHSVLVKAGGQVCALYHIEDTPMSLSGAGRDWEWFVATLMRGENVVPLQEVGFHERDPRVVLIPLTPDQVAKSGAAPYTIVADPAQWPDAVLVGAGGQYYGECRFQMDPATADYVRMDRRAFSAVVGNFSPRRGDLVFSRRGELLGIMVNGDYCFLLTNLKTSHRLRTGTELEQQRITATLSSLSQRLTMVPQAVQ
jgi:peptidoglycan hydrolase CwlO-like protein